MHIEDLPDDRLFDVPIHSTNRFFRIKTFLFITGSVILTVLLSMFAVGMAWKYIGKQRRSSYDDLVTSTKATTSTILDTTAIIIIITTEATTIITTASK